MPTFLLPRLSADAAKPVQTGQWEHSEVLDQFLIRLADDIVVAKNENRTYSIDSIPDIWAKPLFFQMALYATSDAAHQNFDVNLHEKVQGEWRALLAMLALNDMRHLNLDIRAINLNSNGGNEFERMLVALAPKDSASGNVADWNDIYIIFYKDKSLAITSPTTLVATSADYSRSLAGSLNAPWSNNGQYLTDPIPYLNVNELSGLYLWLNNLKNNLHSFINPKNDTCLQLLKALDNYIKAIVSKVGRDNIDPTITVIAATFNMNIGIFQFLNTKVQAPPANPNTSSVRILTSPARATATPLLLISTQMLKEISDSRRIPMEQLSIWAGISAVDINKTSLTGGRNVINGIPITGAEWRYPEDFFTEQLLVLDGSEHFKINDGTAFNILNVRGSDVMMSTHKMSVIIPLRQEILDYFTPKEIAQNFFISKEGTEIKAQFTFPLSGSNGKPFDYKAEKIYHENNENEVIYLSSTVPAIEIWPNFKRPGWQKYYLYYENPEAQNDISGAASNFFYVYPFAYGKNIAGDTPPRGLSNLYAAKLSGFPDALICTVRKTNDGIHAQNIETGFILLNEPQSRPLAAGNSWQIGIDFGTSSTMIYYRNAHNPPQPLILKPNLFQITNSGDIRVRTFQNFVRSKIKANEDGSFLSIFQLLNDTSPHGIMPSIRPLQDGNVLWLQSADGEDADYFRNTNKQIDSNLKWKVDPLDNLKVEAYIKQICLQSLVEAAQNGVGNISWNFSYPTAFSVNQQMNFTNTCNGAVNEALQDSGFTTQGVVPNHWAESHAAAYYFSNAGGFHLAGGAVCLDIGAGTTDITIISGMPPKIVFHTSLKFAGRYLFKSIYKNYDVFCNTVHRTQPLNFSTTNSERSDALIDADMRKHSRDYLDQLRIISGQRHVQKVLQIAQFAMAGLFYYIGGLIKFLHEKGIYKENNVPRIYIGGNGSRILSWICGGVFANNNPYMSVFKDIFVETSKLSLIYGFNLFLSNTPKIEVARGMVENIKIDGATFFDPDAIAEALHGEDGKNDPLIADSVFAGDTFILNYKPHDKTNFISAYDIGKNGISIELADELKNLAQKFNSNRAIWDRGNPIDASESILANVSLAVYGFYASQFGQKPEDISVEPVFILELKKFMEMLS